MRDKDGKTKTFTNPEASAQPNKIPDSIIRVGRQVGSDGHPSPSFTKMANGGLIGISVS